MKEDIQSKELKNVELEIIKQSPDAKVIALAGNPNVGKSTVFNNLTGMNQHTGCLLYTSLHHILTFYLFTTGLAFLVNTKYHD